jgi:uncharacterized RDD family membrane protein YckC
MSARGYAAPTAAKRARIMVTPEGIALPVTLASRGTRFGALLLDLIFIGIAMTVTTIVLGLSAGALGIQAGKSANPVIQFFVVLWFAAIFLFRHAYFLFFELGARGATPGKRISGIRIAARDGGRLSAEMVLARNLLRDIELFTPALLVASMGAESGTTWLVATAWFMLFALFPFFNRDRLRAGDLIAGSWVVEAPRRKLEAVLSTTRTAASGTSAAYRFSDAELAIYGEYELQTLERVLRENRHEAQVAVHEAICRKIGWNPGAGDEQAFLEAYYTQLRARLESGMRLGKRKADKWN